MIYDHISDWQGDSEGLEICVSLVSGEEVVRVESLDSVRDDKPLTVNSAAEIVAARHLVSTKTIVPMWATVYFRSGSTFGPFPVKASVTTEAHLHVERKATS